MPRPRGAAAQLQASRRERQTRHLSDGSVCIAAFALVGFLSWCGCTLALLCIGVDAMSQAVSKGLGNVVRLPRVWCVRVCCARAL